MKIYREALEKFLSKEKLGRCDFHSHSFLSDGVLLPMEQLRRAYVKGHECYAITDHASAGNLDIIQKISKDCELAIKHWDILALPGVELTHVPKDAIEKVAEQAREKGAAIIVVHGETITEPVEPGTNLAAAKNSNVDILAHPGMLSYDEAFASNKNNVFIEITSHRNHSITNAHVAKIGLEAKVNFIQNTDTHKPQDMLTYEEGEKILQAVGIKEEERVKILQSNVRRLLEKILKRIS